MKNISWLIAALMQLSTLSFAQSLVVSPVASTPFGSSSVHADELLRVSLTNPAERQLILSRATTHLLLGDTSNNQRLDDILPPIDALAGNQNPAGADVTGWLLSFENNVSFADGSSALDGDIVTISAAGHVHVVYPESMFASLTLTNTIDIDAFHIAPDGALLFSFDADETTTSPSLISQNGGSLIDETTVFRWVPGAPEATILYDRPTILGFVNTALGTSLTTVVDLTGLCDDPMHPGEFIFSLGSVNSILHGRLFTTAAGGKVAMFNGQSLEALNFGYSLPVNFGGLALETGTTVHFELLAPSAASIQATGNALFEVRFAAPNTPVRLFGSAALLPYPTTTPQPTFGPLGYSFLSFADPYFYETASHPGYLRFADFAGTATWIFPTQGVPTGLQVVFQALDFTRLTLSLPILVTT